MCVLSVWGCGSRYVAEMHEKFVSVWVVLCGPITPCSPGRLTPAITFLSTRPQLDSVRFLVFIVAPFFVLATVLFQTDGQ